MFAKNGQYIISTILGSCVSICLWDPVLRIGGMNHYLLPLWNGEGLPTPRYGNVAIAMLIEKMVSLGSRRETLKAKIFGGASVLESVGGLLEVGSRNISLAEETLELENIDILGYDVGGTVGRKIIFFTESGDVFVRKFEKKTEP
ncbi:MAG: chemotaxis protein CheD [Deltaproteobacteria bacterium RIFCSPLOWO2_02_FULL_53_8]|nr:MAG: chemotaxis protein CheD [Deltaproteobacteria bacterium RIFCSPLOWO2_02_FULL_53_8]